MSFRTEEILSGVYLLDMDGQKRIATRPSKPESLYGEHVIDGYRIWDPFRSKLSSLIQKSRLLGSDGPLKELSLPTKPRVLYLGAANGNTVSFLSDILENAGIVYAVEFSPRSMRDLLRLCEARKNIIPILEDASNPSSYSRLVEPVDMIYQDIAQRNQAKIAVSNSSMYLKPNGLMILMIKARSVDSTAPVKEVWRSEVDQLVGYKVLHSIELMPFHEDHLAVITRKGDKPKVGPMVMQ